MQNYFYKILNVSGAGIAQSVQATGWAIGVIFPTGAGILFFATASRPTLGPPSLRYNRYLGGVLSHPE